MPHDEPFCIIGSNGRFHPRYGAYLPAIEPAKEEASPMPPSPALGYVGGKKEIDQLKATINYLEGMLREHIEASKRKRKGLETVPPLYIKKE